MADIMGDYERLGRRAEEKIPDARLVELEHEDHTPHFEDLGRFIGEVLDFLEQ